MTSYGYGNIGTKAPRSTAKYAFRSMAVPELLSYGVLSVHKRRVLDYGVEATGLK